MVAHLAAGGGGQQEFAVRRQRQVVDLVALPAPEQRAVHAVLVLHPASARVRQLATEVSAMLAPLRGPHITYFISDEIRAAKVLEATFYGFLPEKIHPSPLLALATAPLMAK